MDRKYLMTVAVYDRPDDYPDGFVTRRHYVFLNHPQPIPDMSTGHFPTLAAAKAWIELMHPGLEMISPDPTQDHPNICAVYV